MATEARVIPLLNGEQYLADIRCPDCGKLMCKVDLKMSTGGVFTYDKLKVMLDVSLSAAADCERCRKIQKQDIKI